MFDKAAEKFPSKEKFIFLSHCGVSPVYGPAAKKEITFLEAHARGGGLTVSNYSRAFEGLHQSLGKLLKTAPENISYTKNTAEGLCMIANGYPFQPGDEVISYVHEFPANHYPWKLQERRGVKLVLLSDCDCNTGVVEGKPRGWSMEELERLVTKRTRLIAVSHVQFASGFAADLAELGDFCKRHQIDLVIDAAQSLGSLPLYPEQWNVSAIASSAWKWLLGPLGTGVFYTTPQFREKLAPVMVGAEMMTQGTDYLNHAWQPFVDGRRFEYSTAPLSPAIGLQCCLEEIFTKHSAEEIRDEIFRLQDVFLEALGTKSYRIVRFAKKNRSGIIALIAPQDPAKIAARALQENVVVTVRGGYIRVAPHFYNDDAELIKAAAVLNSIVQ